MNQLTILCSNQFTYGKIIMVKAKLSCYTLLLLTAGFTLQHLEILKELKKTTADISYHRKPLAYHSMEVLQSKGQAIFTTVTRWIQRIGNWIQDQAAD